MTNVWDWLIWIAEGFAVLTAVGVIVIWVIIRHQNKQIAARPPYRCVTFHITEWPEPRIEKEMDRVTTYLFLMNHKPPKKVR